jgi:hypothetical protein
MAKSMSKLGRTRPHSAPAAAPVRITCAGRGNWALNTPKKRSIWRRFTAAPPGQ